MKARIVDFALLLNRKQRITLELDGDFREQYDVLHDEDVDVKITKHRQKRSLDANAYCWVLIDKIAEKMRFTRERVYRDHIRRIGGVSETVCVQDKAVDRLRQVWSRNGIGFQTETFKSKIADCTNVILYYGSSTYDTKQMSALIDSLIDTCRQLGIETKSAEEIESLIRRYENV